MLVNSNFSVAAAAGSADIEPLRTRPVGGTGKRVADLMIAATSLVMLIPLMLIIAALIKLTMGGPVFYYQSRIGHNGKRFRCYKFRSMLADADKRLADLVARDPEAAAEWTETRKLKNDPRVTRFGQILRKSSLDELPQFYNVLIGDMSCIGPRPIVSEEIARYGRYAPDYFSVRPGITGLWQVSGRSSLSYSRRIALDRYYVRRWSPLLDASIALRTLKAVMSPDETS
ncbi:sugar transferase [Hyphomicrobium sp. CS1GBMeth3]|uniref:sugar transferase n=1 Tax=Hyphomicrobium sp. CS1GBMeth3 TaxID=1892845 RepID=UPI0009312426|nr:sugar transferase [Hyphomicrobium sp. CS1GBMeth3]